MSSSCNRLHCRHKKENVTVSVPPQMALWWRLSDGGFLLWFQQIISWSDMRPGKLHPAQCVAANVTLLDLNSFTLKTQSWSSEVKILRFSSGDNCEVCDSTLCCTETPEHNANAPVALNVAGPGDGCKERDFKLTAAEVVWMEQFWGGKRFKETGQK